MSTGSRFGRRQARVLFIATLTGTMMAASLASAASAECNPSGADTSFLRTAPYAQRIVVGRVVDTQPDPDSHGPARDGVTFTLGVQRVLRGPSVAELRVDHLETGGCIRWLSAADGDVIALAFETGGNVPNLASATAAWIEGKPPTIAPYEVLTLAEVLEAAAAPRPPDTATVDVQTGYPSVWWLVGAAAVAAWLAMRLSIGRRLQVTSKPPR